MLSLRLHKQWQMPIIHNSEHRQEVLETSRRKHTPDADAFLGAPDATVPVPADDVDVAEPRR